MTLRQRNELGYNIKRIDILVDRNYVYRDAFDQFVAIVTVKNMTQFEYGYPYNPVVQDHECAYYKKQKGVPCDVCNIRFNPKTRKDWLERLEKLFIAECNKLRPEDIGNWIHCDYTDFYKL